MYFALSGLSALGLLPFDLTGLHPVFRYFALSGLCSQDCTHSTSQGYKGYGVHGFISSNNAFISFAYSFATTPAVAAKFSPDEA